jgi:hypothetical protein
MAKITDPDFLTRNQEITFYTQSNASGSKSIRLTRVNQLSYDGVTGQCAYSKCKELWKSESDLIKFPFPLISITEKKFDMVNRWDWYDNDTRWLLRDCGWSLKDDTNASLQEWMGFVTLGTLASDDQVYYQQSSSKSSTNNVFTGSTNNAVQIYGSSAYGGFDYRDYFKCFVRTFQRTYDQSELEAIGETAVTYQVYAFPLTNATDPKITHADPTVATGSPYTSIKINYLTASVPRTIGSGVWQFNTIINGAGATKEQIYERIQYQLRQDWNINNATGSSSGSGTVIGKTADSLLEFVGDTLVTSNGVFVDNISDTDINFYQFYDTASAQRTYPYVAAGTITFNTNLTNDLSGSYKVFFTSVPSGSYGSGSAILVNNNSGQPITGSTYGVSSVTFTFDYDGNIQGGRLPQTEAPITIVAIGLGTAQYVSTVGSIVRSNANAFSLVASLERNYSNL